MKFSLPNGVTSRVARVVLKGQKHSPTILFAVGVTSGIATVVTACHATLKVEDALIDIQKDKLATQEAFGLNVPSYTEKDYKKDLAILQVRGSVKLAKLYGPSFILGITSIACLTGSHKILVNRNAGLAAAYTAVQKGFDDYRGRVREELGEEKDREFQFGKEVHEVEVVDAKGNVKTKKVTRAARGGSVYARFFGEDNQNYTHGMGDYNVAFLRGTQLMCNQRLQARGHLFLNEVYDDLGLERTPAGSQVGWLKEKGDGCVDFGIWSDQTMLAFHDFVLGNEGIWLDFNVMGEIWKEI